MGLKTNQLKSLIKDKILVDIFTDRYNDSDYGYIIDFNDTFLLFEKVNDDCYFDGISAILISNISRIRWSGNELQSVAKIIGKKKTVKYNIDLSTIEKLIISFEKLYKCITFHIQDQDDSVCFIGNIEKIDNETVVIYEYGTKGNLDRKHIMLDLDDVTRIDAGGKYEQNLETVFELQKQRK